MAKSIQLTRSQWGTLKEKIEAEYPPSVLLLRSKMKDRLGFTTRNRGWLNPETGRWQRDVVLDFFSEKKHTWFLMKYSDFVNETDIGYF